MFFKEGYSGTFKEYLDERDFTVSNREMTDYFNRVTMPRLTKTFGQVNIEKWTNCLHTAYISSYVSDILKRLGHLDKDIEKELEGNFINVYLTEVLLQVNFSFLPSAEVNDNVFTAWSSKLNDILPLINKKKFKSSEVTLSEINKKYFFDVHLPYIFDHTSCLCKLSSCDFKTTAHRLIALDEMIRCFETHDFIKIDTIIKMQTVPELLKYTLPNVDVEN